MQRHAQHSRELLLESWADAVRAGDPLAEQALWGDSPAVAALGLTSFDVADTPDGVDITWQLPDDLPQVHRIAISVDGRDELLFTGEPTAAATPLWRLGTCTVTLGERSGLLVLGPTPQEGWAGRPLADWARLADRAAAAVTERTGEDLVRVWLQLPTTSGQLALLGAAPAESAAASCWVMGDGPIHVLLDPVRAGALNEAELVALLTHEIVHIVTDSPRTDLPLWVEEGYAEAIAWAEDEDAGWQQTGPLLAHLHEQGAATFAVPTDDEFASASPEPYARAWTVCRWLQDTSGASDPWSWLRDWYGTTTALSPEQVGQWQDWLVEQLDRT